MTGLEKIIEKIMDESNANCESIIKKANADAEAILDEAEKQGKAEAEKIISAAEKEADNVAKKAASGAQLQRANALLATKIEIINSTLAKALQSFKEMPEKDYFDALVKLAVENVQSKDGVMMLSADDLKRMPADFEATVNNAVSSKGAKVTVSDKPAAIESGFILAYGDVEINCTFDSLLESYRDELKDKVCEIIFA
ncbi:MAG: hypothetical protein K5917_00125 [Clostridiales bacterium]|nr:hypothetical protein [Clostridiales bacterium]